MRESVVGEGPASVAVGNANAAVVGVAGIVAVGSGALVAGASVAVTTITVGCGGALR